MSGACRISSILKFSRNRGLDRLEVLIEAVAISVRVSNYCLLVFVIAVLHWLLFSPLLDSLSGARGGRLGLREEC